MAGDYCRCSPRNLHLCDWCAALLQRYEAQQGGVALAPVTAPVRAQRQGYEPPATLPDEMLELPFMEEVRKLAKLCQFKFYHTYTSKKSAEGFPDTVLTKPGRLIIAELKRVGAKPTAEQQAWLSALQESVPEIEVYLWTPKDWPQIVARLREKRHTTEERHHGVDDEV